MLGFIKKLFGSTPVAKPAPYKVEAPAVSKPAKTAKPKAEKKPTVKKAIARKPKAPKA